MALFNFNKAPAPVLETSPRFNRETETEPRLEAVFAERIREKVLSSQEKTMEAQSSMNALQVSDFSRIQNQWDDSNEKKGKWVGNAIGFVTIISIATLFITSVLGILTPPSLSLREWVSAIAAIILVISIFLGSRFG